jgi:hypothetical protein
VPCRSLAFVAFRHANPYGGFLLCVASLLSCLVGHRSDPYRTLIRSISDTVPDQTGHPSDPIGKLSDISPDDCPTSIGTLSALNRNPVRLQIGLVSGLRRNTHPASSFPRSPHAPPPPPTLPKTPRPRRRSLLEWVLTEEHPFHLRSELHRHRPPKVPLSRIAPSRPESPKRTWPAR